MKVGTQTKKKYKTKSQKKGYGKTKKVIKARGR